MEEVEEEEVEEVEEEEEERLKRICWIERFSEQISSRLKSRCKFG